MRVVIVTGLSGAGKSTALRAFEDLEFYCVDNLPVPMLPGIVSLLEQKGIADVAMSVDARQHHFVGDYRQTIDELTVGGHQVEVLFLEASDETLLRRYSETRRRHPMAGSDLPEGIRRDREILAGLREGATAVHTGALNVHQLKGLIEERYRLRDGNLAITLLSFGFKNGVPTESDLVFDVRYLPNPYFVEGLSQLDGRQEPVAEFVLTTDEGKKTVDAIEQFLRFSLPRFESERKQYLTVAIGCTGGRHRSVALAERISELLSGERDIRVRHRDLEQVGGS